MNNKIHPLPSTHLLSFWLKPSFLCKITKHLWLITSHSFCRILVIKKGNSQDTTTRRKQTAKKKVPTAYSLFLLVIVISHTYTHHYWQDIVNCFVSRSFYRTHFLPPSLFSPNTPRHPLCLSIYIYPPPLTTILHQKPKQTISTSSH